MIKREKYLKELRPFYDSDLIKIITGIRRCGKSMLMQSLAEELSEKTGNTIFLNFEDESTLREYGTAEKLLAYVEKTRQKGKCYIFLDEIQEVKNWALAVKTLRLRNNSVFISGSNSKLLSKEFATQLSGRYVSFQIKTFVYKEALRYAEELGKSVSPIDYLVWGGFPKRFEMKDEPSARRYFSDLESTIIIKDLIKRYKIKKPELFKKFVNYVLRSNSRILSVRSIHKYLLSQGIGCSSNTILNYMHYLTEAYIIEEIPQYSSKTKRELNFYKKIYDADVCFSSLKVDDGRYDLDHNLENIVYNELIYRGYSLKVFDNKGREIDFMASKNGKEFLIQVAYSIVNDKAYKREFEGFEGLDNANQKIIISNDDIDYSTSTVRHIKFKDFLLLNEL